MLMNVEQRVHLTDLYKPVKPVKLSPLPDEQHHDQAIIHLISNKVFLPVTVRRYRTYFVLPPIQTPGQTSADIPLHIHRGRCLRSFSLPIGATNLQATLKPTSGLFSLTLRN